MLIVARQGQSVAAVAASLGVAPRTVSKWWGSPRRGGAGRAARPLLAAAPQPTTAGCRGCRQRTQARRRLRRSGPTIARQFGLRGSTGGLTLRRLGLDRFAILKHKPTVIRHERKHPGEPIHIVIATPGRIDRTGQNNRRGKGWEYLHVAIDDASRLAFIARLPVARQARAMAGLRRSRPRLEPSVPRWPGSRRLRSAPNAS